MALHGPIESLRDIHPLTPELKRVNLYGLIGNVEIVSPDKQGPHTLPNALKGISDDPKKRMAIIARMIANGFNTDLVRPGDIFIFDQAKMVLIIEKASGDKYAIPLADETIEPPTEYRLVSKRENIKIKTRRAWENLQEAADAGLLYRVLQMLDIDPANRAARRAIWAAMQSETADAIDILKEHRQLKDIDEAFLQEKYMGSAKQNRAMIEFLRWKHPLGGGKPEEQLPPEVKRKELSPKVKTVTERLKAKIPERIVDMMLVHGDDSPKTMQLKGELESSINNLARHVAANNITEETAVERIKRMGMPLLPEDATWRAYKLSEAAEKFAKASGLDKFGSLAAHETSEGDYLLKTAKGLYAIHALRSEKYEIRDTHKPRDTSSILEERLEGLTRKAISFDNLAKAIQKYEELGRRLTGLDLM